MKKAAALNHFVIFIFAFTILNALSVFAGPSRTTYQAKIIKPDGYPLEAISVNFKFTILDPAGSCILYSETFSTVNMGSSAGLVSFSLGTGVRTFPVVGSTFEQVFSNTTASLTCDAGGPATYSPSANDTRKIVMQFNDGNGWQTLPAMTINAVPYAMYANDSLKFSGKDITDFVQVASLPTCGTSEAMRFNGVGFSCIAAGGSGTITSGSVITALGYTPADGASITAVTANLNSVSSTVFSVSSTVTSLQNSVAASFATITSSQWTTSGTNIFYNLVGSVGIGTTTPVTKLDVLGGVRIGVESTTCAPALAGTLRYNANNVEYCNGSSWQAFGVSGAGITNFNGSTSGTQTLATGTGGTAPNFNTSNGVHTLNIPLASTGSVTAGLISNTDYTTFSNKITSSAASIAQVLGYVPADSAVSGTYVQKANNLSDLTNVTTARTNLGLGTFATASSIDLGSVSATGTLAIARLPSFTGDATIAAASNTIVLSNSGVAAGTYTKVTVDSKGRVISGSQIISSDVTAALGYTPANSATITSSQWTTSGTNIYYNTGNVGIGTTDPEFKLSLLTDAGIMAQGTYGSGATLVTSGAGTRMFWYPRKAAFRAGEVDGSQWNDANVGNYSTAFGFKTVASGWYSFAAGEGSTATNDYAVAFGSYSNASGYNSFAAGEMNSATNQYAMALGTGNIASGYTSIAMGKDVTADSYSQITIGRNNMPKGGENPNLWVATDPMFVVGNGTGTGASRSTAMMILKNGNVGIGTTAPTAKLHLVAGTSSTTALKFTSGTLLTSPQSGSMEYDGTNLYFTDSTNTRRAIAANANPGTYDNVSNMNSSGNITLTPIGSVVVSSTTASTNSSTGALVVNGGAGIAGNLNVAGTISGSAKVTATGFRANQGAPDAADSSTNGYAFGVDGDTGMFSPGSGGANGVLAFYGNNTEMMRIAGGNVGIGTTNPAALLQLSSSTQLSERIRLSGQEFYQSGNTDSEGLSLLLGVNRTGNRQLWIGDSTKLTQNSSNTILRLSPSSGDISSLATDGVTAKNLLLNTNGGNVGIGTAGPQTKLHIAQDITTQNATSGSAQAWNGNSQLKISSGNNALVLSVVGTFNQRLGIIQAGHSGDGVNYYPDLTDPKLALQPYGGNVGIGTTSPSAELHISGANQNGGSTPLFRVTDTNLANSYFAVDNGASANDYRIISAGSSPKNLELQASTNSNQLVLNTNGNVGIGTNSPGVESSGTAVSMSGGMSINGTNATQLTIQKNGITGLAVNVGEGTAGDVNFYDKVGGFWNRAITLKSGNVGIGTSSPAASLDVGGVFKADAISRVVQSGYVREINGYMITHNNWPTCSLPAKIYTIGTFGANSGYGAMEVEVTGTHRGIEYYFEHKKWVITYGDYISSRLVEKSGTQEHVDLWNGASNGPYTDITPANGKSLQIIVNPYCGATKEFTVKVKYDTVVNFTPSTLISGKFPYVDHTSAITINPHPLVLNGNVGIGTTTPTYGDANLITNNWGILTVAATPTVAAGAAALTLANQKATPAAGDRVGAVHFVNTNNGSQLYSGFINVSLTGSGGANGFGGEMSFFTKADNSTSSLQRMVITNSGNVGIGTTSPAAKLEVRSANAGALTNFTQSTANAGILIDTDIVNGTHNSGLFWRSSNNNVTKPKAGVWMYQEDGPGSWLLFGTSNSYATGITNTALAINPSGSVGIGLTNPTYQLQLSTDSAAKPGTSTWTIASDERLKDIRAPFTRGLEELNGLHTVYFNYKTDNPLSLPSSKVYVGIKAQDVLKVIPEAVSEDEKGFYHVTNDSIIWTVVNAVKELYYKFVGHDQQLVVQSREIASLKVENAQLKASDAAKTKELEEMRLRLEKIEKALNAK